MFTAKQEERARRKPAANMEQQKGRGGKDRSEGEEKGGKGERGREGKGNRDGEGNEKERGKKSADYPAMYAHIKILLDLFYFMHMSICCMFV